MESKFHIRSVQIPIPKIAFFKSIWHQIYTPLVELYDLQIRFNLQTHSIDLRTKNPQNLEKCVQFIDSLMIFQFCDSLSLLKRSDVFIDSFEIKDVKRLKAQHIGRAIGRIIGREGKIKKNLEDASNTKIVVLGEKIHLIGSVDNMRIVKDSICRLIMGSEPSKVCNGIRNVTGKIKDRIGMFESVKDRLE